MQKLDGQPNVVQLLDVCGSFPEDIYIVLEKANGGDLFSVVERETSLSEPEAVHFMLQILDGVSACHALGIAHGDLKLENMLIFEPGAVVKLCDFDLARSLEASASPACRGGSRKYAAPELFDDVSLPPNYSDTVADMWSLGIVWFTISNGTFPWEDATVDCDLFKKHMQSQYLWPSNSPLDIKMRKLLHIQIADRLTLSDTIDLMRNTELVSTGAIADYGLSLFEQWTDSCLAAAV